MKAVNIPAELSEYHSVIRLPVQWGDQDAFGHVNNTVYFRWFESARIAYFQHTGIEGPLAAVGLGPILASIKCDYRRQITYPDVVLVGARVTRVGNSSLSMRHGLYSERLGVIAAEGDSVIVAFDYEANASKRIPEEVRTILASWDSKA